MTQISEHSNQGIVKLIEQYVRKGSKVLIQGKLETRKFTDQNGTEKYLTEVVLRPYNGEIVLLDGKPNNGANCVDQHNQEKANAYQTEPDGDSIPF